MAYPKFGHEEHMSAAEASEFVRKMIHREEDGPGAAERAMKKLARDYKISFWTLDHLRKNKAKTCDVSLFAKIKAAFIDHCTKHAERLRREAQLVQEASPNDDVAALGREIQALADRLAAAQAAAKEGPRGSPHQPQNRAA